MPMWKRKEIQILLWKKCIKKNRSCAVWKQIAAAFFKGDDFLFYVTGTILGILCTLYFVLLAAVGMDFSWIWLAAAIFFFGMMAGRFYFHAHGIILGRSLRLAAAVVLGAGILIFVLAEGLILSKMTAKPKGKIDYMIVLGAQVRGEKPSRALVLRMEKAAELWKACGEPVLLLSGGKGDGEQISEAECMYRYLSEQGIPKEKMILEDRSVSTQENLKFCAQLTGCKEKKTAIVSNNFHIYRAVKLAEKQGYQNVCGIAAQSDWRYQIHYMIREAFALVKEKLNGNID